MGALFFILLFGIIALAVYGGHALYADWARIRK
jgi:hypothetical protein